MKTTSVFSKNLKAYHQGHRVLANKGSTRSSKTWSELQMIYMIARYSAKPLKISLVSRTLVHLKSSAIVDFDEILESEGYSLAKIKHGTDHVYRIGKSRIDYFGADQLDRVHGPGRDILVMVEANFIKWEIVDQLIQRTAQTVFIDFNPSARFWLDDELIKNEPVRIIQSTYLDNEYCPEGIKKRLDMKRDRYYREKAAGTITKAFENYCKVYLFGEEGSLEGTIYENWRFEEPAEIENAFMEIPTSFGLDYGFHPDPDAMTKIAIDRARRKLYLKECIYNNFNGTKDLIQKIGLFCTKDDLIIAESASPRTNQDLSEYYNIVPATKRVGDKFKKDWIRELQDYEFIITNDSQNLATELQNYVWSDRRSGTPIDGFDHALDGILYNYIKHCIGTGGNLIGIETF